MSSGAMARRASAFSVSRNVWFFRNVITSQVILSPVRALEQKRSMDQLPAGRRLHPTKLRQDHWLPFAKASFASPDIMRRVYARLLQFRHWRAHDPVPLERRGMTTKARETLEMNQVPTSVADLAACCEMYAKPTSISTTATTSTSTSTSTSSSTATAPTEESEGGRIATIKWLNEEDKVYAEKWPEHVVHLSGLGTQPGAVKPYVTWRERSRNGPGKRLGRRLNR